MHSRVRRWKPPVAPAAHVRAHVSGASTAAAARAGDARTHGMGRTGTTARPHAPPAAAARAGGARARTRAVA
eukprot:2325087-Pleurochrysis_carterae.AAC.1